MGGDRADHRRSWTRRIGWGRSGRRRERSWTRSSTGVARAASGTACRRSSPTTVRSIGAFQRWRAAGVFRRVWAVLIERCEDLDGVDWEWQAADGAMGKARKGGTMLAPTRPTVRKGGVKRSLLVEGHGRPLSAVVAGANVRMISLLNATIEAMVLERPEPEPDWAQHLAIDAAYDTPTGWETTIDHDYVPAHRAASARGPPAAALTRRIRLAAGSSSAHTAGSSVGALSSSAGNRRPRTTSASSSSPAPSSGAATTSSSPHGSAHDHRDFAIRSLNTVT